MNIGLILHPLEEKKSGLGRMAYEFSKALVEAHPEEEFVIFTKEKPKNEKLFASDHVRMVSHSGPFWLDRVVRKDTSPDAHLFFTPMIPFFTRVRRACVFAHDFAYLTKYGEKNPFQVFLLKWLHLRAFRKAERIFAVSHATKDDIVRLFGISPQKIEVVYNGIFNVAHIPATPVRGIADEFFLYVGAFKERKNIENMIRGFAEFKKVTGFQGEFVLTGGKGSYQEKMRNVARELGIENSVRFLGFVNDAKLSYLYQHARAFLFASRVEGFGMAALEALSCGTPVIAANSGVLKEVLGDAALFVHPENPSDIARALTTLQGDSEARETLKEKGRKRALLFTWRKAADAVFEYLHR